MTVRLLIVLGFLGLLVLALAGALASVVRGRRPPLLPRPALAPA
jgi:hypothetical protein